MILVADRSEMRPAPVQDLDLPGRWRGEHSTGGHGKRGSVADVDTGTLHGDLVELAVVPGGCQCVRPSIAWRITSVTACGWDIMIT